MNANKTLGYRPDLVYKDEYTSDADNIFNNITSQQQQDNISQDTPDNTINDLIEQMEIIESLIDRLPDNASDIVGEVVSPVIDFIRDELKDKEISSVPEEEEWTYDDTEPYPPIEDIPEVDNTTEEDMDNFDEEDFWGDVDPFPITVTLHTKQEITEKEYVKNLVDLFNDYATNMHNVLSNFWTNMVACIFNKGTDEIDILLDNILLSSSNIQTNYTHLLDSAISNQIHRSMKLDFYSNIFNAEESITHLRQLKAMYELRLRYAKIEESDGSTKSGQMNNNILEGMRTAYDLKYDVAYENLLRYLKSSIDVLDDTLKTWLIEIKSKQVLIERKGIK